MTVAQIAFRMILAALAGMVLGIEREKNHKPAGFKTHALVSLGAALVAIIELELCAEVFKMNNENGMNGITMTMGRIICQVVSGIGFLGAGCILHKDNLVAGITTAATIWVSAGIGIASGLGYYKIVCVAVILAFLVLIAPRIVVRVKNNMKEKKAKKQISSINKGE